MSKSKKQKLIPTQIDEISFVNKGANQKADVIIFKSDDINKSLFTEALSTLELKEEYREFVCELMNEIYTMESAFRQTIDNIIEDETIEDKNQAITDSLWEFASALVTMIDIEEVASEEMDSEDEMEKAYKTENGKKYPSSDFAYVPDPEKPSTWKLRLTTTPGGKVDPNVVRAAVAALGAGFRGNKVKLPSSALPGVKRKVRAAYKEAYPDVKSENYPEVLKIDLTEGNDDMSEELKKQLDEALAAIEALKAENKALAFVAKLDSANRAIFDSLKDEEKADLVAKDFNEAVSDISKRAQEDEVITVEGLEIHKADISEEQFRIMKSMNAKLVEIEKARQDEALKVEMMEFAKKADEEYPNVMGTLEGKAMILKSIAGLPEDVQNSLNMILKSYNEAITKGFSEIGTTIEKAAKDVVDPVEKSAEFFKQKYGQNKENK